MNIIINDKSQLSEVMEVAKAVFQPSTKELEQYHNKNDWIKKLNKNGLLLTANNSGKVIGFAICYEKQNSFHIWNVGVLKEFRQKGIWKALFEQIVKYSNLKEYNKLTINTFKDLFPNMYDFLTQNGFEEIKVENGKSYFEKQMLNQVPYE